MDQTIYLVTLVGAALVVVAAFSSLIAFRFGAPLLLLFLAIGLASGTDGLGIDFDNARFAYFAGSLALAVILFDSGFGTPLKALRQAALPALSLATFGVVLTTGLFGIAAHYLTDFTWLESLLLGAAVASTDAAALSGKTVGAQASTTQAVYADEHYGKAGATVKQYPTQEEAMADLTNGRLDAVISDKFVLFDWMKTVKR